MSDDTPTQRYPEGFPPPGGPGGGTGDAAAAGTTPPTEPMTPGEPQPAAADELPTERFSAAGTVPPTTVPPYGAVPPTTVPPTTATTTPPPKNNKGLIITLSVIGGVLLLAVIGLLIWIAVSGTPDPAPTETATPTPTPTATETPTPTPTPSETTEPPPPADVITSFTASTQSVDCATAVGGSVPVTFSWATTGVQLWFGVGTDDAKADPFDTFPLEYTIDFDYQCGQPDLQQRYTITVERTDGSTQSETIVISET